MWVWQPEVGAARAHKCEGAMKLKGSQVLGDAWMAEHIVRKKKKWDIHEKRENSVMVISFFLSTMKSYCVKLFIRTDSTLMI